MPKDPNKVNVFHCNFKVSKDIYRKFRHLAAEKTISVAELYREAAEQYVNREWPKQQQAQ